MTVAIFNKAFFSTVLIYCSLNLKAQQPEWIVARTFIVNQKDTQYNHLRTKLPYLVCYGILNRSSIQLKEFVRWQADSSPLLNKSWLTDTLIRKKFRRLLDTSGCHFYLEGEINISNDQFYLHVNLCDFTNNLIVYQSELSMINDFSKVVDKASEYINAQIKVNRSINIAHNKLQVKDFILHLNKNLFYSYNQSVYSPDFPSRYLAGNLKGSGKLIVLPYQLGDGSINGFPKDASDSGTLVLSGEVEFENDRRCSIHPALYIYGQPQILLPVSMDLIENRDALLLKTLNNIQSFLDAMNYDDQGIVHAPTTAIDSNGLIYQYRHSISEKKYSLATYFAQELGNHFTSQLGYSEFLQGNIYYAQDEFDEALTHLRQAINAGFDNDSVHYLIGRVLMKKGDFNTAYTFINGIDDERTISDFHLQKGICLYNMDSTESSIKELKTQLDISSYPDAYLYLAYCYRKLKRWNELESTLNKLYLGDTANRAYSHYLGNFYSDLAKSRMDSQQFDKAYRLYSQSEKLFSSTTALSGMAKSAIQLNRMDLLDPIFTKTATDPELYLGEVYLDVAEFCRNQLDSQHRFIPSYLEKAIYLFQSYLKATGDSSGPVLQEMGSTFFRLKRYDEAERYYLLVKNREPQNYTNYFNLVEVQLMEKKLMKSQETLQECYKQFIVNRRYDFDSSLHLGLYYFYLSEIQTLRHLSSHESIKALKKVISDNQKVGKMVFIEWSFRTFYYWMLEEPTISREDREKLLTNLCLVIHESNLSTGINCLQGQ